MGREEGKGKGVGKGKENATNLGPLAEAHLRDTLVPALDDHSQPELSEVGEPRASVSQCVELSAPPAQGRRTVNSKGVPRSRELSNLVPSANSPT